MLSSLFSRLEMFLLLFLSYIQADAFMFLTFYRILLLAPFDPRRSQVCGPLCFLIWLNLTFSCTKGLHMKRFHFRFFFFSWVGVQMCACVHVTGKWGNWSGTAQSVSERAKMLLLQDWYSCDIKLLAGQQHLTTAGYDMGCNLHVVRRH